MFMKRLKRLNEKTILQMKTNDFMLLILLSVFFFLIFNCHNEPLKVKLIHLFHTGCFFLIF